MSADFSAFHNFAYNNFEESSIFLIINTINLIFVDPGLCQKVTILASFIMRKIAVRRFTVYFVLEYKIKPF